MIVIGSEVPNLLEPAAMLASTLHRRARQLRARASRTFVVALLLVGCADQSRPLQGGPEPEATAEVRSAITPLQFEPASGLGLHEVIRELKVSLLAATEEPPGVFLELDEQHDSRGKYTIGPKYSDLPAFASAMQGQDSTYEWEVVNNRHLFVYPATGAMLSETIGAFQVDGMYLCELLKELTTTALPSEPCFGCLWRDVPKSWLESDAHPFLSSKHSVSLTSSRTRPIDVLVKLVEASKYPLSAVVLRPMAGKPFLWMPNL